jgi:hypothetical protein
MEYTITEDPQYTYTIEITKNIIDTNLQSFKLFGDITENFDNQELYFFKSSGFLYNSKTAAKLTLVEFD